MSNPWFSHGDDDETDGAANPWLADDGASETDEIDSSQLNNGGLGRAIGGGGVDSGAGDNGNGNVDNNDNFSDFSDDAPLDPEDDEELRALHERDFGSAGPAAAAAAALAPFVSLYPPDLALTILTKFEVESSKMEIFGRGLDDAAKRTRDEPGYLNSLNFQRRELSSGSDGDPSGRIAGSLGGVSQGDVSSDGPLDPEDDEELRALHERDFGSAGPAAAAAAALAPFVSLYPPDLAVTTLTKFEVDPLKMKIFSKDLAEVSRRTCAEPGYLHSADFQRCPPTGPIIGQAEVAKAATWTSEEEPDYRHSSISQRREHSAIAGLEDGAKSEQYDDEDDRKPAAVYLSDTHAARLEAPVLASAISQSKDSKDGSNTTRKRGRDANLSLHEAKHEPTRKDDPELPMKHPDVHNVLNYGKVTRMDLLHAAGNNSYNAAFFSSMLMNGALKSFMHLSMWHQCNHSVEHELRRKGQVGPFVIWRTRYLDLEDHLHKHCVIKSLCQIANYFQPEEVEINDSASSPSVPEGNNIGCVSYEILVSNDVDRGNEIVELSSWVNKNAYLFQQAIFHSSPELQESRTVVDLFCDLSKQEETCWVSNPQSPS
jgi:quinol monooxygenase YgiN